LKEQSNMKSNIDKAINFLQIYRIDHDNYFLEKAQDLINQEVAERKKARQVGEH